MVNESIWKNNMATNDTAQSHKKPAAIRANLKRNERTKQCNVFVYIYISRAHKEEKLYQGHTKRKNYFVVERTKQCNVFVYIYIYIYISRAHEEEKLYQGHTKRKNYFVVFI